MASFSSRMSSLSLWALVVCLFASGIGRVTGTYSLWSRSTSSYGKGSSSVSGGGGASCFGSDCNSETSSGAIAFSGGKTQFSAAGSRTHDGGSDGRSSSFARADTKNTGAKAESGPGDGSAGAYAFKRGRFRLRDRHESGSGSAYGFFRPHWWG
ncbi:hypothetical protein HOP50_13g70420 [Chloropicon primus]|uniref:Uncharacterized protein n=1 Tax=Chloropicon primus TaxID=1764295 RepID=A0A5B8MVA3_9CHLO|nr:hypothetical protein A3770_13p70210 [Chloropicon primus]UPR03712.1 hypothetical protein HOP50_13g70420 [Chloropicon primus]|eukprot:QDZ24503.1 hypothetical protein A3770_13p70210 [Chloropicon primus]